MICTSSHHFGVEWDVLALCSTSITAKFGKFLIACSDQIFHFDLHSNSDEQKVSKGGGVEDEDIEVIELSLDEAKSRICARDEDLPESRPAAMLFALMWFFSRHETKKIA